tara:strand:- start:2492 stop:3349 length:858 start_codon:yes stop_codon:yes gene_type:complete
MSETDMIEEDSNPYNMKKSWHEADGKRMPQADELYYEDEAPSPKATRQRKSAPNEDSSNNNHNYKKRYDDLKRRYDQKLGEFRQKEMGFEARLQSSQPQYEAPKSQEEIQEFRNTNPDLYDTVETVAHSIAANQLDSLQPRLSALEQREHEIAMREAEQSVRDSHPDYDDLRGDPDFHAWAEEQPEQIQDWVYRNPDNVALASKAIDLYKMESGKGQNSPKRRSNSRQESKQSAADMVSTKTTNVESPQQRIWTETEISKMSLDQFDKHEEDIRLAIDEGRVRNI